VRRSGNLAVIDILKSSRSIALNFSQGERVKSEVRSQKKNHPTSKNY